MPQRLPIEDFDWSSLIPLIGRANRALARFDGVLQGLQNPEVLLSPMTTQEAVLSSEIEGTTATLSEVLKFEAGQPPASEAKQQDVGEILNYRTALRHAKTRLQQQKFDLSLLLELHRILLNSVRGRDKDPGKFRVTQNWIGKPDLPQSMAYFVPPPPDILPAYLENWGAYYHMERPDPIVQLAVVHAQFEILHPFRDGNGRLGRILVPLFLYERKILSKPVFYLSAYLERHREQYVQGLRKLTDPANWQLWIAFFLEAVEQQAAANSAQATKIQACYEDMKARVLSATHSQFAIPLLDQFFRKPILKTSDLFEVKGMPSRPMLHNLLGKLKQEGILRTTREGRGRRPEIICLPELINICEGRKVV
ncbi:MAG: Fic family protein [Gammaproteobacteria bacterium]